MSADTMKREDGINRYSFNRGYKTVQIPGHEIMNIALYQWFCDRLSCGKGEGIDELFAYAAAYANKVVDSKKYTFSEEAAFLKELLIAVKYYKIQLNELSGAVSRIIDAWISKVDPREMTKEQKQQDVNYVLQREVVRKREEYTNRLEEFILNLMNGELSDEDMPTEKADPESLFDSVDLPLMTHLPEVKDIEVNELKNNLLYQVLYNIVATDVYEIVSLFHDYNNGNVCVRLWKKDAQGYSPCFCSIKKTDVYVKHIGYGTENAFWPGLIEAAVEQLGIPNDKSTLAEAILGPEVNNHNMDRITGRNLPVAAFVPKEYNGPESEYAKSLFEIYIALVRSGSLFVKDTDEYFMVRLAIEEVINALYSCFDSNMQRVFPACKYLKEKIAAYKTFARTATMNEGTVAKKRVAALNTATKILDLMSGGSPYRFNPREYFERTFTSKIAEHLLESNNREITAASVDGMTEKIYSNIAYKSAITAISIYMLDAAPQSLIERIAGMFEKR